MNQPILPLTPAGESGREESQPLASRRHFLGGLGLAALSAVVADPQGPRERPLHEADFYAPHTLAG